MNYKTAISVCLLALAPLTVHAQKIFMCKDATGKTLTSDRPIPDCAGNVKELDNRGIVRREIKPPPTAAEKEQMKRDEEKKQADELAAAERKRNDKALLARFRNEDDIAVARKRNVDLMQDQIKRENAAIANLEKKKSDIEKQITLAKGKKDVEANLKKTVDEIDGSIRDSKKRIQDYESEIAQINEKYDATLKRYRELTTTPAAAR
jgi:hypothetical protein